MLDFFIISTRSKKSGVVEIYPKFIIKKSKDLMIRGSDFYAIWNENINLWSTDEQDALHLIDLELDKYYEENKQHFVGQNVIVLHMWDAETGMIDIWHKYCQKQLRDNFHMLDEKIIFSNDVVTKKDYASKKLSYPLEECPTPGYNTLMETLYSEEERHKIEWAIGSIVTGDSKVIQKFIVLYGSAGTGKSTILNIIMKLFDGYYSVFDAKALGSSNNSFALEAFKTNPLISIQHDGDLSHIEDNTRLNSLVSHELMTVNEKFKSAYQNRFKSFLFMGTNKPVKITDSKSGLIRRLIDVTPSGNLLSKKEYDEAYNKVDFELGGIACRCRDIYLSNPGAYNDYIPLSMMGATNDFYNFMTDSYPIFKKEDGTTLKIAWEMYNQYCEEAKVLYPLTKRVFKEELKTYFREFYERKNGVRNCYDGLKLERFENELDNVNDINSKNIIENSIPDFLNLKDNIKSVFDETCADYPAQYAVGQNGIPEKKWIDSTTSLKDLDTSKLHFVKVPINHIVIDFDIVNSKGEKDLEKNIMEASKWPPTYAELSKSGNGLHLHYIYNGDVNKLCIRYDDHIEIKIFSGNSSLRRKLTKCNSYPINEISSGLPLKGDSNVINLTTLKNEKHLRTMIKKNLCKEIHGSTTPSIYFIQKLLDDAYNSGMHYDVTDMRGAIFTFAANSTNQSEKCIEIVQDMKFKSDEPSDDIVSTDDIVFFDTEVFPNLFLVNWKIKGPNHKVVRMINPTPMEIERLLKYKLVGFNCRKYDNHVIYACLLGYNNMQLYNLSQELINSKKSDKNKNCFFSEAYNLSYTDVHDFCSEKKSLKKWEIELGIHHKELGLPWDKPVPESMWQRVAEYCDNDVIATEKLFDARQNDFLAREILADLANSGLNDTSNSLTTKIVFGKEKNPNLYYTDLATGKIYDSYNREIKPPNNYIQAFPGYRYENGKNIYMGEDVGRGGYVYAEPGMYENVALLDIASMHPHSAIAMNVFGDYTKNFEDLLNARIYIKHGEYDKVREMFGGKLSKYLTDENSADALSSALKIPINSVYGLTSASFPNPFKDNRNSNNIVALRGALFMINLKHEVKKRGFKVAHIKTDSIKIPNATPEIIRFVVEYGKKYGYTFEHEATYDRMCLVNDAVYIAKYSTYEQCCALYSKDYVDSDKSICKNNKKHGGEWTATGKQFAVPYVFKTLFSKEPLTIDDFCETFEVTTALYLDMNEDLDDISEYEKEKTKLLRKLKSDKTMESEKDRINIRLEELNEIINNGHNYIFVGKVGCFTPIKSGYGGGVLLRISSDGSKYDSAPNSKGYRWKESETIKNIYDNEKVFDQIDKDYYISLCNDAIETITKHGDYYKFVSSDPINSYEITYNNDIIYKEI